ncbi:MAG: hypothetical protein DRG80_01310, partial [Deltaproteobacteria bacterium]
MKYAFERNIVSEILQGLNSRKKLLRIMTGPRQVGKTTAAGQVADRWPGEVMNASADSPLPPGPEWIHAQWGRAARMAEKKQRVGDVLLILDEIQKVAGWSEAVKFLWDEECRQPVGLQVLLLGSSSLLLEKGFSESLAGRFFLYRCPHWQYPE